MSSRLLTLAVLLLLVPVASAGAAKPASKSWAQPQIELLVSRGIMGTDASTFRPNDAFTRGAAASLVASLTGSPVVPTTSPTLPVSIAGLDSRLVRALALQDSAARFLAAAKSAGLAPPSRFGTEAAARLLGLRTNHPAKQDGLELLPTDTATRAEAAFSAARILQGGAAQAETVRALAATFALPPLTVWQKRVLSSAVSFIGYPYVWGGTAEWPQTLFGVQSRGGFDCSGFVWRVFKQHAYPGGTNLAATLKGRTTYQMSGEIPPAKRVPLGRIAPADVLFFGANGPRSKPAEVNHMGIYLGNGWIIHSSHYGVALTPLSGWYRARFAWARRPLAESGLETGP